MDVHKRATVARRVCFGGGSALSLQIDHRISEDLDLCFPAKHLPAQRLEIFLKEAEAHRLSFQANDNEAALHECSNGGMDLRDFQQDYIITLSAIQEPLSSETSAFLVSAAAWRKRMTKAFHI